MLLIPIQTPKHEEDMVIVILDEQSIARMSEADPAEVILRQCGKHLINPTIQICFEKDHAALNKFIHRNDIRGLIKYLGRGWKYRPDKGDHDRGPESIKDSN